MDAQAPARSRGGNQYSRPLTLPVKHLRIVHESYFDGQTCTREARQLAMRLTVALSQRDDGIECQFMARRISQLLEESAKHERCVQGVLCAAMESQPEGAA
jgi:hypothetical protein